MAARGNRLVQVGRFGVAFVATAAVALGPVQAAFAQEAAPPPAATNSEQSPSDATPPAAPAPEPTPTPEPTPSEPEPEPDPPKAPAESEAPPAADPAAGGAPETDAPAPTDATDAASEPAADEVEQAPTDVVKLEEAAPAAAPAPAAATPVAPSAQAQAPASASAQLVVTVSLVEEEPAAAAAAPELVVNVAALGAETDTPADTAAAPVVSIRPAPAAELWPADEPAAGPPSLVHVIKAAATEPGRRADLRPPPGPRAALGTVRGCSRRRRPPCQAHLRTEPGGGAGGHRPRGGAGDGPQSRSAAAAEVEGRAETSRRRGPADLPVRELRPGGEERRLQRLVRLQLVLTPVVRARGRAAARALAVPVRPVAPPEHASARRDPRSSQRSTRIAPRHDSERAARGRTGAGRESCGRGQMSWIDVRMEDR